MQINWHYVEIALVVIVVFAIFYMIIRYNRDSGDEEIMPDMGDVDALMDNNSTEEAVEQSPTQEVSEVSEVRVLSEEETKKKLEEMEKSRSEIHKTGLRSFKKSTPKKSQEKIEHKETFIIIHVMAQPGAKFIGYDLYQSLTSAGLTYGDMKIFHRYAEKSEKTKNILFSVASAVNPGTIDLDDIGAFSTIGLTLFMDYSKQKTASATFQLMLNTAKLLAEDLNGVILDANRQTWSLQSENECRRKIQHYNMQMGRMISG